MRDIKIGNHTIGRFSLPYIIAEAGVNHESNYETAFKMIENAKIAGAHAIKFQTYEAEDLVSTNSPKYWKDDNPDESQFDFFKRSSTWKRDSAVKLAEMCNEIGITFLSTGFDKKSVDLLDKLGMQAFKVASADLTSLNLLQHIARLNKPMILSTGAANIGEIETAVQTIKDEGNKDIIILHCILSYPTPKEMANLGMIRHLSKIFPDSPIGFSDHIIPDGSFVIPIVATALGAKVYEKHYTLDRTLKGNDHFHSVDPMMLKKLVDYTTDAYNAIGSFHKHPIAAEIPARKNARRSVGVVRDLNPGETLNEENLTLLRPGTGIEPIFLTKLYGRTVKKKVKAGNLLDWSDFQ